MYTDYTEKHIFSNHLILVLDESGIINNFILNLGSMEGKPWTDLMAAVKDTMNHIVNTPNLSESIKITVINYESSARIIFNKMEPSLDLLDLINYHPGGTNFEVALQKAYQVILDSKDEFDIFTVGFLTDGRDCVPKKIINVINADAEKIRHRIFFNCVLFGNEDSELETIAKHLNAKYNNAIGFEELKDSFKEIISVIGSK